LVRSPILEGEARTGFRDILDIFEHAPELKG